MSHRGGAPPGARELAAMAAEAWELTRATPGFLAEHEAKFLALAAAGVPADGVVLEIGSLRGKSTICLAHATARYARDVVVAVDPHTSPAETDASLGEKRSSYDDFIANLAGAGLLDVVEVHRAYSRDLAPEWKRPIRLLWIDGDHTYAGAKEDVELFRPHLAPGGIIAFHDVMHGYEGPDRVFPEEILLSDEFGAAGLCGSIGWAQFRPAGGVTAAHRRDRRRLATKLARLAPLVRDGARPTGLGRLRYRAYRALVPHKPTAPEAWLNRIR